MAAAPILLVMGVSGAGKTTLGEALARRLGWPFLDADELHPAANVEKMRASIPLDDSDRAPWFVSVGAWIDARAGEPGVVACSALKRAYRQTLRTGRPQVRVVYLRGSEAEIGARLRARTDHYWPAALLPSQFAALEPPGPDEDPIVVDVGGALERHVDAVVERLADG